MAAVAARRTGSRRRTINEINMVPFIDVMLVLLIIFMVCAPLMTPGLVDLPSVGQAQRAPDHVVEVVVDAGGQLRLRLDSKGDGERINLRQLPQKVLALQGSVTGGAGAGTASNAKPANVPVVISADKGVQYETVVKVMDSLQRAGVARVGLAVRTTGNAAAAN
ncbi:MAG: ExbD/TolR family protein [Burkholderiales bacterium]|nr:ExbD/TolR family protein [Burkholderiales bacterium]